MNSLADLFDVRAGLLREVEAPVGEVEECEDGRHNYPAHIGRVANQGPNGFPADMLGFGSDLYQKL